MSVGSICRRNVYLATHDESVLDAARRMRDLNVGTLLVLDPTKRPVGMVTDRDLTVRVLAAGAPPAATAVREIMTLIPETVAADTSIEKALGIMRSGRFRRLPVVDAKGALVGILSLDDVLELLAQEFGEIGRLVRSGEPL